MRRKLKANRLHVKAFETVAHLMGDGLFYCEGSGMKEYKIKFRCIGCNKLLAKTDGGDTEIKCPRCGIINRLSTSDAGKPVKEPADSDREQ